MDEGITRLLYSPTWLSAQQALAEKMKVWEMQVYYEQAGNLFGRLPGKIDNTIIGTSSITKVILILLMSILLHMCIIEQTMIVD
jgi:allantoate deiminase